MRYFMRYYLIKNPIKFKYYVSDSQIELFSDYKDLRIIFDTKLNFTLHSEMIRYEAIFNLGFIKRTCRTFSNPPPLKYFIVL